jgi:L-amino acid N-acyltransferase YncA
MTEIQIRNALSDDAKEICAIYNPYVLTTTISFEELPVSIEEMERRIIDNTRTLPWLLACSGEEVLGYAYATAWKARSAYRASVETTVYVSDKHARKGIGSMLYRELIQQLRERQIHCAIGGIAQPNIASAALHQALGFEKVAEFKEVGYKFDRWINVAYWELLL